MNKTDKKPECQRCNGTEYYSDAGFYYCAECHLIAENVQQTLFVPDEQQFRIHKTITLKRAKKVVEKGGSAIDWTSWHGHNYVLIGLVNELIKLGAKPDLKNIVLQLWTKYLGKIEAAFFSKSEAELPKFWYNQHEKDFKVIYGRKKIKKLHKVRKKSKKITPNTTFDANTSSVEQRKALRKMRKIMLRADYERVREELSATQDPLSQVDDTIKRFSQQTEPQEDPISIEYSTEALRIISMREQKLPSQGSDGFVSDVTVTSQATNNSSPHILSRQKLIALIILALHLTRAEIQISDLLRWIVEGHLSYYKVAHLFPERIHFSAGDAPFLTPPRDHPSYQSLLLTSTKLARLLEVESLPPPDLASLTRRYVTELKLPVEMNTFVERLIAASSQCDRDDDDLCPVNYEGMTMAYIIVVLKMLFGLDDSTEHCTSKVAREVNSLLSSNHSETLDSLFVWDDWVCYTECRKSALVREHFPSRFRLQGNFATSALEPYLEFVRGQQKKDRVLENRMIGKKSERHVAMHLEKIRWSVAQLPNYESVDTPSLKFAPTLTPYTSYLDTILNTHREEDNLPTHILSQDFTKTSIRFLVEPQVIKEFANTHGLKIEVREGSAARQIEIVPTPSSSQYELYGTKNYKNVTVQFVEDNPIVKQEAKNPTYKRGVFCSNRKRKRDEETVERKKKIKLMNIFDIPAEASGLLWDQLKVRCANDPDPNYIPPQPKRKTHEKRSSLNKSERKHLVLYLPHKDYWSFHCEGLHFERSSKEDFDLNVASNLPTSFHWLLTQCSQMLQMSVKDLYVQLCSVETSLSEKEKEQ